MPRANPYAQLTKRIKGVIKAREGAQLGPSVLVYNPGAEFDATAPRGLAIVLQFNADAATGIIDLPG